MLKLDVHIADMIIDRGFLGLLNPIVMEAKLHKSEVERILLVRTTVLLFSNLSDIQDSGILVPLPL